jgi:hypothetical protein
MYDLHLAKCSVDDFCVQFLFLLACITAKASGRSSAAASFSKLSCSRVAILSALPPAIIGNFNGPLQGGGDESL